MFRISAAKLIPKTHANLFFRRATRRCFAQVKIEVEADSKSAEKKPASGNFSGQKYKPNFFLNFDKNGRLLLYSQSHRLIRFAVILICLAALYTGYQFLFRWNVNGKWKNIACMIILPLSLFGARVGLTNAKHCCTKLYLMKDGATLQCRSIFSIFPKQIRISEIEQLDPLLEAMSTNAGVLTLSWPEGNVLFDLSEDSEHYCLNYDLLDAVHKGNEVDITNSGEDSFVNIN